MARVAAVLKAKSVNELWFGLIPIQIIGFHSCYVICGLSWI